MSEGLLVVFEGIDGSGKSTQLERLRSWLASHDLLVRTFVQPGDSLAGRILRRAMREGKRLAPSTELALFMRDRRQQAPAIARLLREGFVVLLDRHYLSSVAYQGALGLDPGRILEECLRFCPVADLTFLFDLDPKVALARITRSRSADAFERLDYLARVRELYLVWATRLTGLLVVDAQDPPDTIAATIASVVREKLHARGVRLEGPGARG